MRNSTKKLITRSLSGFLTLLTLIGLLASLSMLPVFADDEEEAEELTFEEKWNKYYTDPDFAEGPDFTTEEKRIEAMGAVRYSNSNFEIYVDEITGEVAIKDKTTGDILFTNPYDVAEYPLTNVNDQSDPLYGKTSIQRDEKMELLSQISISYIENGVAKSYNSFEDAALLDQIKVKRLNGGVRVEYSIGEEESRLLVPQWISTKRFEEMILAQLQNNLPKDEEGNITSTIYDRMTAWYVLMDPNDKTLSSSYIEWMNTEYKCTASGLAIYVFDAKAATREKKLVESWIKQYCPRYTFEELDADHKETGYNKKNIPPANFKLALEYYLTDNGVEVRLPANGLTFDEVNYALENVEVLKYMGAGLTYYNGYTFVPDGSGSITRFEDTTKYVTQSGKIYGQDFAYHQISGGQNQQVFRLPVFGVATDDELKTGLSSSVLLSEKKDSATGYVAVVTEGDALTTLTSINGGKVHCYGSVYCSFNPRPKDSYSLADAISIGGSTKYTVVSERKYTGSFRINYIMLTDKDFTEDPNNAEAVAAAKANGRNFYDATYMGMATAYREYLESNGEITRITTAEDDIPLYIEAFGVTETEESVLSFPVTVKKALTSFDDLKSMVTDLSTAETPITNINFRLKGFTNGGIISTAPTKVKFEKVVGGNSGFRDFLDYAVENGIGVYPEFDFAYMESTEMFDGFSYKRDAVKTIDDRYITKRVYDPILQTFTKTDKICISTGVYRDYFEKFNKSMTKILDGRTTGISASTLGSDLNSDFDSDDPYNRDDSKIFTEEMLDQLSKAYNGNVMIDGGNAFAISYASVVLNLPLDSSRFLTASQSIPFIGLVYHGYVELAGEPTNMAGDIKYETLKIIENGATVYMMLSYQNVELLKDDENLSQYYAISYNNWKDTLFALYENINSALKDVQTSVITDHQFVNCTRKLTDSELEDITIDANAEYAQELSNLNAVLAHHKARLKDYERIMSNTSYTDEQKAEYLLKYNLDEAAINSDINVAQANVDAYVAKGVQTIIDRMSKEIDVVIDDGSVVYVEYENGHWFILNYNNYEIVVDRNGQKIEVAAKDFYDSNANS